MILPQIPHFHKYQIFFKYICKFLDQLLHPYKFYGRDMSGILFFIFASCEPLTVTELNPYCLGDLQAVHTQDYRWARADPAAGKGGPKLLTDDGGSRGAGPLARVQGAEPLAGVARGQSPLAQGNFEFLNSIRAIWCILLSTLY